MSDIDQFLKCQKVAVAGASTNRNKYGNKVVRAFLQNARAVIPINPKEDRVEGLAAVASVSQLPDDVEAISIVTPPAVTLQVVAAALEKNIRHIWMQPGAENPEAVAMARNAGANLIADGACVLVALGYREIQSQVI